VTVAPEDHSLAVPAETVREGTADDLDALVAMATAAVDEQRDGRGGALWSRREARRHPVTTLSAAMGDPDQLVLVGCLDSVPAGYGVVRRDTLDDGASLAVVDDIYVDPAARGVGLGEALMNAMVDWARQRGCVGIDALALPGNRATKNFFETFGLTARAIVVHRDLGNDGP
jgi:GNAT superfamily N-acetyltransferase